MASVRGGELIELADMSAKPDPRKVSSAKKMSVACECVILGSLESMNSDCCFLQCLLSRPIAPRQIRTCLDTPGFIGAEFKVTHVQHTTVKISIGSYIIHC